LPSSSSTRVHVPGRICCSIMLKRACSRFWGMDMVGTPAVDQDDKPSILGGLAGVRPPRPARRRSQAPDRPCSSTPRAPPPGSAARR
jgi:hypothetical protein